MVSKDLFRPAERDGTAARVSVNRAGGVAFDPDAKAKLAQYAATGMFGGTYYVSAKEQVEECSQLAAQCDPVFVAKCAIYARRRAGLKDVPAFLTASLAARMKGEPTASFAFLHAFRNTMTDPKMVRNFVQIIRSGTFGRKNLGSMPRRAISDWFGMQSPRRLLNGTVGGNKGDVSLRDVIRLVRPRSHTVDRAALYGYLVGSQKYNPLALPPDVREYEDFKSDRGVVPDVDFRLLDGLNLQPHEWRQVAMRAPYKMTLKNLNTFKRHGVLDDPEMTGVIAQRLSDRDLIEASHVFPYELLAAYRNATDIPVAITAALNVAADRATDNIPAFEGMNIAVCPDVSGSMHAMVTGSRGVPSQMRYVDVAALVAASFMRRSTGCIVLPFDNRVFRATGDAPPGFRMLTRDTPILVVADALSRIGGGGTDCSLPLRFMNDQARGTLSPVPYDLVVFVSDNESWMTTPIEWRNAAERRNAATTAMRMEWQNFKRHSPMAKLVCIDIAPSTTQQVETAPDVLNVGGFSDAVWPIVNSFLIRGTSFVDEIESFEL